MSEIRLLNRSKYTENEQDKRMKIYILSEDVNNYRTCILKENSFSKEILKELGKCKKLKYDHMLEVDFESRRNEPIGDIVSCPGVNSLIVNKKIVSIINSLRISCQNYPIKNDKKKIYSLSIT